jgi:heme oxygenase
MVAGENDVLVPVRSRTDVLRALRDGTAAEHETVERTLDLLDPALGRGRLTEVLTRMHGFWLAAEAGLDAWTARFPHDAAAVEWTRRRRAGLFAADLDALGAAPARTVPDLADLVDTDAALGRLYVLEGSTLGGTFIDRHLAGLPELAGVRLRAFSPYGPETGRMWQAFRRAARAHVDGDGDAAAMVASARTTFRALAAWCAPAAEAA